MPCAECQQATDYHEFKWWDSKMDTLVTDIQRKGNHYHQLTSVWFESSPAEYIAKQKAMFCKP